MQKAFFISPIFAAVTFTILESYQLMNRPDSIYIPIIFKLVLFGVGYVAYGLVNATFIVPLSIGLAYFTPSRIANAVDFRKGSFSPAGEGWDEGDKYMILFSSPNPLQQERA